VSSLQRAIDRQRITVLVTHWWEYFRAGKPHDAFVRVLHETADYLASRDDVAVIPFSALATSGEVSAAGAAPRSSAAVPAAQ
jgi:hypothetical protein